MKKIFLTGVLLAMTASYALAQQGVNLAWNTCRPNGGAGVKGASTGIDCAVEGTNLDLVGSFKPGSPYPNFTSLSGQVDLAAVGGVLPDWWKMGSLECRDGQVAVSVAGGFNATFCPNSPWGAPATTVTPTQDWTSENNNPNPNLWVGAGRARLRLNIGRSATVVNLNDQEYFAFRARISSDNPNGCQGCTVPVCIRLENITIETDPPTPPRVINTPLVAQHVEWQVNPTGFCPDATPTRSATWGQIKALYR